MAQNVTIAGASYTDVTAIEVPKTTSGVASFHDVTDTTATASDVLSGKSFYNASGVKTSGSIATKSSSDLTASGATVTAPAGYYASSASKSVASGSARTPDTTITSNPSISVSSSGLITASNSKTKTVAPTVTAGYVSSGTAGTITVSGSNTQQLTTKAAATYTPGTTAQTIASGQYLTGAQTIAGDTNLVPANIAEGVSIFGVTGTHLGGLPEEKYLNFYDYDGTLLYSYARGETLVAMPPNPSHAGLVSDGWNWSIGEIEYAKSGANGWYSVIDVGQLYHRSTNADLTSIFAHMPQSIAPSFYMQLYFEGNTQIHVHTNDGSGAYEDVYGQDQYVTIGPFYVASDDTEFQIEVLSGRISFVNNDAHPIFRLDGNADGWENNRVLLDSIYKILIGQNVSIGYRGLSYLQNLETILIPNTNGITSYGIGAYAFEGCIKLKHVNLPVVSINEGCFKGCKKLRAVTFAWSEDVIQEIPDYCFLDSGIVHTSMPYSVYLVGEQAFKNSNLERLGMNVYGGPYNDPINISANAFYNCIYYNGLIYLNDWLMFGTDSGMAIDNYAYFGCKSMQMPVVLGYWINWIGNYAFSESCITELRWTYADQHDPAMSTIHTGCCKNCKNLSYVFLPETITDIYDEAFANCTSLSVFQFNSAVPPIVHNSNAFANLPTYCEIWVPGGSLSAYTSATNYPSSSTYTYIENI